MTAKTKKWSGDKDDLERKHVLKFVLDTDGAFDVSVSHDA